jgi:Protein of unknown function (DUF4058)
MPSPFVGMNPYLEAPELWAGIHHLLIGAIAQSLNPILRPHYFVAVEERIYDQDAMLVGIPDDVVLARSRSAMRPVDRSGGNAVLTPDQAIAVTLPMPEIQRQGYLEVRQVETGEVVTAIELLSPINKRTGLGRRQYEAKRQKLLTTTANLVEIDLLRQWLAMPVSGGIETHYRILVSRSEQRPKADLFAFNLTDAIPTFALPLLAGDAEPIVDLKALLETIYDQGSYDLRLDYATIPAPKLSEADRAWVAAQLSA